VQPSLAAAWHAAVRRGPLALSPTLCGATRSGAATDGVGRRRLPCAAPRPPLRLPGEPPRLSHPCAEDGRRDRHPGEVAEDDSHAALQSSRQGGANLQTGVGPPHGVGTWSQKCRQSTTPSSHTRGSHHA
jgi:hypothetical protein